MRNRIALLAVAAVAGTLMSGCAHITKVEEKFGRGISNTGEIVRAGEFRRTMEQSALFESPNYAYSTGFFRGINRTLSRTGIGIYEVITAPFPPYEPVATEHFAPGPVYPDSYKPDLIDDSLYATDTFIGFSGGSVLPILPGNRFHVFSGP